MTTMIAPGIALFEEFRLDRRGGGLFQVDGDGRVVPVALGARALDLLCVLVERAGNEVSKNAIMDAVWPDVAVEENNLTVQISALRRVLDQDRAGSSCIQTVKGRGYRFVIPVTWLPAPTPAPTPPPTPAPASPGEPVAAMPTPEQDLPPPPFASPARRWWHAGPRLRRGLPVAAVAMSLTLAVPFLGWLPERGATKPPPRMSVAVLPFVSLDGDPEDVRKAEGVTQDLTTDLAFGEMRRVVSQRAVAPYAGMIEDVASSARPSTCATPSRALCAGSATSRGLPLRSSRPKPQRSFGPTASTCSRKPAPASRKPFGDGLPAPSASACSPSKRRAAFASGPTRPTRSTC